MEMRLLSVAADSKKDVGSLSLTIQLALAAR
jgi:hypothetical protein